MTLQKIQLYRRVIQCLVFQICQGPTHDMRCGLGFKVLKAEQRSMYTHKSSVCAHMPACMLAAFFPLYQPKEFLTSLV